MGRVGVQRRPREEKRNDAEVRTVGVLRVESGSSR